jgi:uncharacterized membrane protein YhhN
MSAVSPLGNGNMKAIPRARDVLIPLVLLTIVGTVAAATYVGSAACWCVVGTIPLVIIACGFIKKRITVGAAGRVTLRLVMGIAAMDAALFYNVGPARMLLVGFASLFAGSVGVIAAGELSIARKKRRARLRKGKS